MAVKQNNTETNTASGNAGATTGSAKSVGATGGGAGAGAKTKKMNTNVDGVGGAGNSADQPGCSGTGPTPTATPKSSASSGGGGSAGNAGSGMLHKPSADIAQVLHFIELVELKQQRVSLGQDIFKIYQHLIFELARVQVPRQSPEDLKRFKEDIAKVGKFFAKENRCEYLFYLRVVCQLITRPDGEPPSCAVAIIFQLFSRDMVLEAVQSLLELNISDQNIRKTVFLLCQWLCMCNFCQNLNLWIMAIMSGLQEQQKLVLFNEIAADNIEHMFASLILPVLRPKVAPLVFHMLSSITDTPQVFHKILPRFPLVLVYLKQQANSAESCADDTKKYLQQLVDLTNTLMMRFYGYHELYEPIETALKDFRRSYNYFNYTSGVQRYDDGGLSMDTVLHSTNAKVGLVNLGNTCYMNSVLQALAMTKEFSREILLSPSKSPLLIKMKQQIALMLYSTRYELTPSPVLNATRPPGFAPGLQQDSSEFLSYLLETLHDQEMIYHKKASANAVAERESELIAKMAKHVADVVAAAPDDAAMEAAANCACAQTTQNTSLNADGKAATETSLAESTNIQQQQQQQQQQPPQNNQLAGEKTAATTASAACPAATTASAACPAAPLTASTIEKTFTGKMATTYKCLTCGWKSHNIDNFRDLQLSFPEVKSDCASNYSVQDLIDYYCSPEKLYGDNQYFCERCKKLSDAERYINVISAPRNLILTLKHFKYDQKYHMRAKLMHKVFHDEKVSMKVCGGTAAHEEITFAHYDLYAGVVHSGVSMDSGHYYTYAADEGNKWYKFNDSIVTHSQSEELHNLTPPNTPYILFYQMGARSNETTTSAAESSHASSKVIKVDVPNALLLEELPHEIQEYVNHDNTIFSEELKLRHIQNANAAALQNALKAKGASGGGGGSRDRYDDDDEDQPPPTGGCGGNAMNMNANRYVY